MNTEKTKQIERLSLLLNPEDKSALSILQVLLEIKKEQEEKMVSRCKIWREQLVGSIIDFLMDSLPAKHQALLSAETTDPNKRSLLNFLISSTFVMGIDSENEHYVMLGSSLVNVKKDILLSVHGLAFEDCLTLCSEINERWGELAKIECSDDLPEVDGLIQFSFEGGGLIHDK